jgi:hypothetical protein
MYWADNGNIFRSLKNSTSVIIPSPHYYPNSSFLYVLRAVTMCSIVRWIQTLWIHLFCHFQVYLTLWMQAVGTFCNKPPVFWNVTPFIRLACAECDNSLQFSGASSMPVRCVLFPATFLHQLLFHHLSPYLAIYFLVYISVLLFPNSYITLFW